MLAPDWKDYEIIASGDGLKLERWGSIKLLRPDPQAIWKASANFDDFDINAKYVRSVSGGGAWQIIKPFPERWTIAWRDYKFYIQPTGFKHTGLFPEQAVNWDLLLPIVKRNSGMRILNLFAYTGAVTTVLAKAGAVVTHVDSAKAMVERARNNCELNGVNRENLRFIVDDCMKFVTREIKRGKTYNAVIMDPPSYGRGPNGEMWRMEDNIFELAKLCASVLQDPKFFLLNSYTTGLQPQTIANVLELTLPKGETSSYEVCLPTSEGIAFPCGCSGLWQSR